MDAPVPNRLTSVRDIVNLLKYGGNVFQHEFSRTFAIPGTVLVSYGLNKWAATSITIIGHGSIFLSKIKLFGIDGVNTRKEKFISFTTLSLNEKRILYDSIRTSVGLQSYYT